MTWEAPESGYKKGMHMRFRWPNLSFWNLDFYHKAVCPTITIVLTILAIIAAWKVLGVHERNAEQTKRELENRIEKLSEFGKKLDEAQKTLNEQQNRIEATNATIKAQGAIATEIALSMIEIYAEEADRLGPYLRNLDFSVAQLASFLSRNPGYTSDEQVYLKCITDLNVIERDWHTTWDRHFKEWHQSHKQLWKDYQMAVKNIPNDRREELTRKLGEDSKLQYERFRLQVEKEHAGYAAKQKQLEATRLEIVQRLNKAGPHGETKRKIDEIDKK